MELTYAVFNLAAIGRNVQWRNVKDARPDALHIDRDRQGRRSEVPTPSAARSSSELQIEKRHWNQ